jgi:hypothetical protein
MSDTDVPIKKIDIFLDVFFILLSIAVLVVGIIFACGNISAIGLTLDVSGFILLFGFVVPVRGATIWDFPKKRKHLVDLMSWIGASLVISGFVLQYLGNIGVSL